MGSIIADGQEALSPPSYAGFQRLAPASVAALAALGKAVDDSGLEKSLTELVKLRVSQINGCVFCVAFHLDVARRIGVEAAKLDLVAVWREAGAFSPREAAALAFAEHLARMPAYPLPHDAYETVRAHFSEGEATHLTMAIAAISAWNRIAGSLRFSPPARTS